MRPTAEQVAVAAYLRWERRGQVHGLDRDDWLAAEKDLIFGLNYSYVARHVLTGPTVMVGKAEANGMGRRCRFCERNEMGTTFDHPAPPALPRALGNTALFGWDECDECRGQYEHTLSRSFRTFASPWVAGEKGPAAVPLAAWKDLVRMGLSVLPVEELQYFEDTLDWVSNPDHSQDSALLAGHGCHAYLTPIPLIAPFVAVARRKDDDEPFPYILFFLGSGRSIFQTHLPLCPRDEDLEDAQVRGPELSMTLGSGPSLRSSRCVFLPVEPPAVPMSRALPAASTA